MRHWLLILMIALLPLRGWAAATMAGQMPTAHAAAAMQAETAHAGAPSHQGAGTHKAAALMPDCPEHAAASAEPATAAAPADAADTDTTQASGDCHSCTSCQICHTVAATVNAALPALTFSPHALPAEGGASFASAQPAQGLKPPIS
ncbi:MAG: hypothetical protein V4757_17245 [Pseudomonadota bacterium]